MTDETPMPAPKYIVGDKPVNASLTTLFSLIFFGITLFGALMRLASAHDLNAIRALLMRDDTIGWLTTVITLLAPTFWLVWRTIRAWVKKLRDIDLVAHVPNKLAMLKSEIATGEPALAPTRAPETVTPTRLVGIEALAPMHAVYPPLVPNVTVSTSDDGAAKPDPVGLYSDGPAIKDLKPQDNDADFLELYAQYGEMCAQGGEDHGFRDFAEHKGWSYVEGRWTHPADASAAPPDVLDDSLLEKPKGE